MAAGAKSWDDAGNLLFDTANTTYGLLASGYLSYFATWSRWDLKSSQLDPSNPSNYNEWKNIDAIYGFSVANCIAPIPFINGSGIYVGSQLVNGVTTFFYSLSSPATKIYVFDLMRHIENSVGMKCYDDDAANTCIFNSQMVPLDIVGTSVAPAPPAPVSTGLGLTYTHVFNGATNQWERPSGRDAWMRTSKILIPQPTGQYAVATTFSRTYWQGMQDRSTPGTPAPSYSALGQGMDGAFGTTNGIYWCSADAIRSYMQVAVYNFASGWGAIPTDRYPSALIIEISALPIPYSAYA